MGGGDLQMEVIPVTYSGKQVTGVTVNVNATGAQLASGSPAETRTTAPYVFTLPYNANNRNNLNGLLAGPGNDRLSNITFTVTYADGTTLTNPDVRVVLQGDNVLVDNTFALYNTPLFSNNPPFGGLANLVLDFQPPQGTNTAEVCNAANLNRVVPGQIWVSNALVGVDNINPAETLPVTAVVDLVTTTGTVIVSDAQVPIQQVNAPATTCDNLWVGPLPGGVPEGGFFVVRVKQVRDALGNARTPPVPWVSNPAFGVDRTRPTITLRPGWDNRAYFNNNLTGGAGNLVGRDLNGNVMDGVTTPGDANLIRFAQVNDPTAGTPAIASGIASYRWRVNGQPIPGLVGPELPDLNDISNALFGAPGLAPQGYYTLTVQAVDNAGNASDPFTLNVLYDDQPAYVTFTSPTSPALTGGTFFTATAQATDNVDLLEGRIYLRLPAANLAFEVFSSGQKPFGLPAQPSANYSVSLRALRPDPAWLGPLAQFELFARVRDQARNAVNTANLLLNVTPNNTYPAPANPVIRVRETPDITPAGGGSTTLTITLTASAATEAQVARVAVYRYHFTDTGVDYYTYLADGIFVGNPAPGEADYNAPVSVPTGVAVANARFLIVVEYNNGLSAGYIYNYNNNVFPYIFGPTDRVF